MIEYGLWATEKMNLLAYIGETGSGICIRTTEHLNPKSNSAINKHRQDTDHTNIIFSTVINENNPAIRKITEMLLIKQHNPPLNEINNLINYINITYNSISDIPLKMPAPPF